MGRRPLIPFLALWLCSVCIVSAQLPCSRLEHCTACAARKLGSTTRLFCTECAAGYALATDQRSCWCGPGFYWNATGGTCDVCGVGAWCPGGSDGAKGPRTACGTNMTTTTSRARYGVQCVPQPGSGLLADEVNAAACAVGFYSYGFARKPCLSCPRSLTTAGTGSASRWKCACPPGYRYSDEQAVPCGLGFWKSGVDFSTVCTPCGLGLTTATTTSTSAAHCSLAKRGYALTKSGATVTGAVQCSAGTWSAGGDVTSCTSCGEGATTVFAGADSAASCIARPGYGYNASTAATYACPVGSFKSSLGAFPCTSCGAGLLTNASAATSYSACYIPAGWGATVVSYATNLLEATRCTTGTYGAAAPVYGPSGSRYACQKCPGFMTTQDANPSLSQAERDAVVNNSTLSCVTTPGYGYNATTGWAYACPNGTSNLGYNRNPCS